MKEQHLHVFLTLASSVYMISAFANTLYSASLGKESEQYKLTKEGVYLVYINYVKDQKKYGTWDGNSKIIAQEKVIDFVRNNSSRFCYCFSVSDNRIKTWTSEIISQRKKNSLYRSKIIEL